MSTAAIQKLTVKEAAEQLRISAALVYALCAAKKIRHERHGIGRGTIRIPPEALDEYRKGCTSGGDEGGGTTVAPALKLKNLIL
jgi:excisionase family DNA binding protein